MVMAETQFSPESRLALSTREGDCRARQDSAACVSLSSRLTCQRANPWSANPPQRASGTMKLPPDPTGGVSRRLNGNLAPRPGQRGVSASRQGGFYSNPLPLSTPDFTTSEILFAGPHRGRSCRSSSSTGPRSMQGIDSKPYTSNKAASQKQIVPVHEISACSSTDCRSGAHIPCAWRPPFACR